MNNLHKPLLWITILSFAATVLTTIPLLVNYLKGTEPKFELITHLHVWFGTILIIVVLIRIIMNRKKLKAML